MPDFITDRITSRQNSLIVRYAKLADRKRRDEEGLFRIDGGKLFAEAKRSGILFDSIFVTESAVSRFAADLSDCGRVYAVTDEVLAKLTDEKSPEGIVAVAQKFALESSPEPPESGFRALLLSSVRDPGNLGTIIRTAYALGIDRVYLSTDCADLYSPKTLRASMGTIFRQKLTVVPSEAELVALLRQKDCAVYAATLQDGAKRLGCFAFPDRVCVAVGNEGHGLSEELTAACTGTLIIPMAPGCESLNAAAAAGILCWEMGKARLS